jgi:hypothetical protein
MTTSTILTHYNYDEFVPAKFEPWMRFNESPPLGQKAPDFPLTRLDGPTTNLSEIWAENSYTIVEFGSFT